ncbi:MAG: type I-F CRISPR-associated protein Csy1 [Chlamydiales bacterium]|nr:type I-F CRISPR-associated protein Csy1 [Chlamydiales bacterium]
MSIFSEKIEIFIREKQEAKGASFCVAIWLDSAAKRASQISVATHVLKFTHSDAKGSNIYVKAALSDQLSKRYVSTDGLSKLQIDVVGNAAAMDVAAFLNIEVNGITLMDMIAQDDSSVFASFTKDPDQLSSWMRGFKSIFVDRALSSHAFAKQVYFPVDTGEYHLLAPLFPSSLSHALQAIITDTKFGEKAKVARECKKKGELSEHVVVDFPNLAVQAFGGTKPQNISRLNSVRGGKSYLLAAVPPVWTSIKKPPIKKDVFWKHYKAVVREDIKNFKEFLLSVADRNSVDIRKKRENYVKLLVDLLVVAASNIQNMTPGWSAAAETPQFEQLWLDPHREDFKELRENSDWKTDVSKKFATWVSQQLTHEKLKFLDAEHRELSDECYKALEEIER